jgi:hypothetical protein
MTQADLLAGRELASALHTMHDDLRSAEAQFAGMKRSIDELVGWLMEADAQLVALGLGRGSCSAFRRSLRQARSGNINAIMPAVKEMCSRLAKVMEALGAAHGEL